MKLNNRFSYFFYVFILTASVNCLASDLHDAIKAGDGEKVAQVLDQSSTILNLNQPDENGKTPLHMAVEKNDAKIVRLLLSLGADPEIKDRSGRTLLRIAVDSDSVECVKIFVTRTIVGYVDPLLEIRTVDGQTALKNGTLMKANEMLGRLVRLDPLNESVNFAYGLSWLSLGDPAPAGAAFERVLQINPKNDRARVELARARLAAKRYTEAKKELEQVLSSNLPADVRQNVEAYLKDVKGHTTKWHYSGNIEIGGLYDNNVNVGPDSELINITPVTVFGTRLTELQLSDKSKPADTTGIYLTAGARTLYDIGELNGWFMTADAACYRNRLEEDDCEMGMAQAGIGVKRILDKGFVQIPFRARYINYGGEPLVWTYGLYPSFGYAPASLNGLSFITTSSAELRNFDTLTDRNGYYLSLGEIVRKSFMRGIYSIYGGAEAQYDHTDSSEFEYTGTGLMAGGDAKLPWRLNLFGEARYSYRDYKGKNPLAPEDRNDAQYQLSAGISRDISDRFAITLTHDIINNYSSFDLYEYKRQITTLSTSVRF